MAEGTEEFDTKVMDNWKRRRRFMYVVTLAIISGIAYVLYHDMTSEPAEAMVTMGLFTLGGIVGSYVFGAVWDDRKSK